MTNDIHVDDPVHFKNVGLNDLQKSLPTQMTLCFYDLLIRMVLHGTRDVIFTFLPVGTRIRP